MSVGGRSTNMAWKNLIVAKPRERLPELGLKCLGPAGPEAQASQTTEEYLEVPERVTPGLKLYEYLDKSFWRSGLELMLQDLETRWKHLLPKLRFLSNPSS